MRKRNNQTPTMKEIEKNNIKIEQLDHLIKFNDQLLSDAREERDYYKSLSRVTKKGVQIKSERIYQLIDNKLLYCSMKKELTYTNRRIEKKQSNSK